MALKFAIQNLHFRYSPATAATPDATRWTLHDLNLEIEAGSTVAIVGPNGIGKSTLLYLLGLLWENLNDADQFQGDVEYYPGDDNASREPEIYQYDRLGFYERTQLRLHHFGFLNQSAFMLPELTCLENIALPLVLQGWNQARAEEAARRLIDHADGLLPPSFASGDENRRRLGEIAERPGRQVSGGQRRRLALLRSIIHQPDVLLADEPLSNLDPTSQGVCLQLFAAWKGGSLAKKESGSVAVAKGPTPQIPQRCLPGTMIFVMHMESHSKSLEKAITHAIAFNAQGEVYEGRVVAMDELPNGIATLRGYCESH